MPWSSLGSRIQLIALIEALAVADHLNIRRAASALGISQSSVSQRIMELEEHLGIMLFERRHRGVTITPAGQHFLDEVRRGMEHMDYAVKTAGMMSRGEQGTLRIGFYSSLASGFLPGLLRYYQQRRPAVEITLTEGTSQSNIALLRQNRLDIAFIIGDPSFEDCHSRPLWHEQLFFALPQHHPLASSEVIAWEALRDETFIILRAAKGPELHDHVVRRFCEKGLRAKVQRVTMGRDNLIQMIALGGGIGLICESAAALPVDGVVYRPIAGDGENFLFSALWSPFNRSAILREFLADATSLERRMKTSVPPPTPSTPIEVMKPKNVSQERSPRRHNSGQPTSEASGSA